ncbi:PAS domain S-box protein [Thermithiobacillus plumbiphilus]|uniref:histidine kinase n=1 Tax=Thermithiobacillus plumbiphilus TaxID=1729899 RepID=A0ABU9D8Y9_9PROT
MPTPNSAFDELEIYRTSFEHAGVAMVHMAPDHRVLRVNRAMCQLLGYTEAELRQLTFPAITHPDDLALDIRLIDQLMAGDMDVLHREKRYLHKDGHTVWARLTMTVVRDATGQPLFRVGVIEDIRERKALERARAESESLFAILFNQAAVGMVHKSLDQRFMAVNDFFCEMLGYSREELLGRRFSDITSAEDVATEEELIRCVLAGESTNYALEKRYVHKQGHVIWVYLSGSLYRDAQGEPRFYIVTAQDITARKRAQEALQNASRLHRTILENASIPIFATDWEGILTLVNRAVSEVSGYAAHELIGRPFFMLFPESDIPAANTALMDMAMYGRAVANLETRWRRKDGALRTVRFSATPLLEDGRLVSAVGAVEDITEFRRAEAAIRELNETLEQRVAERTAELQATNQELESFCYSVSHDLRAPLRAIHGFAHILREELGERLAGQESAYLERVERASVRMGQLIDDLLDLSRLTRAEMLKRPVDLGKLADVVMAVMVERDPQRQVRFVQLGDCRAWGDSQLLKVVLEHLLGNAWKFTAHRPDACIEFGCFEQEGEPAFYVRDNGVGFDMAYVNKLFLPFQRLHGIDEFEGTGIGLATVSRIIARHGGRVWAEGQVGEGATFWFTLTRPVPTDQPVVMVSG